MPLGMGGSGILGVGFETTYGTYATPTKFIPIRSESLTQTEDKQVLAPIRGLAVASHMKRGYTIVEGDIEFECTADVLPYFLYAARMLPVKAGTTPNFTYTFTPVSDVLPTTAAGAATRKTLTIHIERATQVFAYLGCSVTNVSFTIDNGDLICTVHVMGLDLDTTESAATPTFATWTPYGPGDISIELPTGTERVDIDTFNIDIQDNGEALNRIKGGGARGPSYIRWGEREVSGSFDHDFLNLDELDAWRDNDSRAFKVIATHAVNDEVNITLSDLKTQTYPINLGGLSDLVRATVDFRALYGGTSEYTIVSKTSADIAA
jgi:hypothetical protein